MKAAGPDVLGPPISAGAPSDSRTLSRLAWQEGRLALWRLQEPQRNCSSPDRGGILFDVPGGLVFTLTNTSRYVEP